MTCGNVSGKLMAADEGAATAVEQRQSLCLCPMNTTRTKIHAAVPPPFRSNSSRVKLTSTTAVNYPTIHSCRIHVGLVAATVPVILAPYGVVVFFQEDIPPGFRFIALSFQITPQNSFQPVPFSQTSRWCPFFFHNRVAHVS